MSGRKSAPILGLSLAAFVLVGTFPIWGMGPAVFLDSNRAILSRHFSPDRARVAQVERLVVGGVPSIVVKVRQTWMPDWYLAGCVAASHYENTDADVAWSSNDSLVVLTTAELRSWRKGDAPFHPEACRTVSTVIGPKSPPL